MYHIPIKTRSNKLRILVRRVFSKDTWKLCNHHISVYRHLFLKKEQSHDRRFKYKITKYLMATIASLKCPRCVPGIRTPIFDFDAGIDCVKADFKR